MKANNYDKSHNHAQLKLFNPKDLLPEELIPYNLSGKCTILDDAAYIISDYVVSPMRVKYW